MLSQHQNGVLLGVHGRPAPLSSNVCSTASTYQAPSIASEPVSPTALKRQRSLADIEGDGSSEKQRKKRRLRLELITPRLSQPYASPNTNIVSRSRVRVGIWTGQPPPTGIPIVKAAILNSIRRDSASAKELIDRRLEFHRGPRSHAKSEPMDVDIMPKLDEPHQNLALIESLPHGESEVRVTPSSSYTPNYDIFDDEDDDLYEIENGIAGNDDDYVAFEEDSDQEGYETLCPFDEVLIQHHQTSPIDSKPENSLIAKEIQFQLPSERLASDVYF